MSRVRTGAFIICVALGGLFVSRGLGLLDRPGPDIVPSRKSVPTLQGVFLYIAVVGALLQFPSVVNHSATWPLLLGGGAMVALNFVDEILSIREADRQGSPYLIDVIPSWFKLLFQFVVLAGVVYSAGLYRFGIMGHEFPLWLGFCSAVVWFLVAINSMNWFDYAYGQASGLATIGYASVIALIQFVIVPFSPWAMLENHELLSIVSIISAVLMIASFVYTIVEYRPFGLLRDVGSWFYGFSLAYLALLGGAKVGVILVVLSLPLFDFIRVIINRIFVMKKNPLKGDYTHLHHRLLLLGWNKSELRRFIRIWSIMMGVLMLLQGGNRRSQLIIFVMMALIFFGVHIYLYWIKKLPFELHKIKKG